MSRIISRNILFVILIFSAGSAYAGFGVTPKSVAAKALLKKMSRVELLKTLGAHSLSDSNWTTEGGKNMRMLLFEPVTFEGVPALVEAVMNGDSTAIFQVYLPYIGRPTTRLTFPFEMTSFVQGTSEDFNQMERKIEDELGIPTVLTGANFEYIEGNTQSMFGVFRNGETRITIVPQTGS